jgi:hypothetical protein
MNLEQLSMMQECDFGVPVICVYLLPRINGIGINEMVRFRVGLRSVSVCS